MKQNRRKFGQGQKVEFKKSSELDHKNSLKALTKFGIKVVHFAWAKVDKMKAGLNLPSKMPLCLSNVWTEEIFNANLQTVYQK